MWIFRRFAKARFPQENEKNNSETLIADVSPIEYLTEVL
jgi:hypothetical protein